MAQTQIDSRLSTGLTGLDDVIKGLIPGDNLVWQVESVDDYVPLVEPFARVAPKLGQKLIYFRFAKHPPIVPDDAGAEVHELHPEAGFETFLAEIHKVIEETGNGGYYVFDCLSDLSVDWYSDEMLANFFMLTCPYLLDVEAIAYFALLRNRHAGQTVAAIMNTAQVLVDVYSREDNRYIYPVKVQQRYSPTMYMLHTWEGGQFRPVTESSTVSQILTSLPWRLRGPSAEGQGIWERTFLAARGLLGRNGDIDGEEYKKYFHRIVRMMITRDERVFELVTRHMDLPGALKIGGRMIGTGLIGGKSVGMLLARAILAGQDSRWREMLEPHDSFFIGSDVFYTYLVRNGLWWDRQKQRDPDNFLEGAERARQRILTGEFPEYINEQFSQMLDYFGQSPIIVRSSSLLEDNFGNAFAGKYESVFCANQGSRQKRLKDFVSAVRTIYASTMSEKALRYRAERGLLDRDEQMALLVQRVSGGFRGRLFYPQIAGVGFSFNPYVWNEDIDASAGMIRVVFGLGTRAVNRWDDDYTRVVALNVPQKRPEANFDEARQYAQRKVDVLDLEANQLVSVRFEDILQHSEVPNVSLFASPTGPEGGHMVLTFEQLLSETSFAADMRKMLATLQEAYDYPVDVEFTANLPRRGLPDGKGCRVNLVQCRPLQVKGGGRIVAPPQNIADDKLILDARGAVIGQSRIVDIERIIYVAPQVYGKLPIGDRHSVARLIGKLTHLQGQNKLVTILLGPGRWGTTTPSLGVPAAFGDISTVDVLGEIVAMREDFVPDVSLGTHYFSDLVERDILYLAIFPDKAGNRLNDEFFESAPNKLAELIPSAEKWTDAVRVIDVADLPNSPTLKLNANSLDQRAVLYLE